VLEERKDEEINKMKMKSPTPSTPIALPPCDFSSKPQKKLPLTTPLPSSTMLAVRPHFL